MANSAFCGMSVKVSSIQHAALVRGYRNLGEIITAAGIQKSLEVELAFILHMADYISLMSGDGCESDEFLYKLEDGTMDFLGLDQDDVGDLSLELAESVANMLDSPNANC